MSRPLMIRHWPRAIAHVDADAFFTSVEQAIHPELKGRPVITGAERGIVAAASYEAKAMGIRRGVPLHEVRRLCPDCVFVSSDYETYSLFSKRLFAIMRRFSPAVEEYSIDEGFADLTGLRRLFRTDYRGIAAQMQRTIAAELGITVSIGVSLSKPLAKLCSKFRKPRGLTAVGGRHIHLLLGRTPLEEVWGFGPNTCALLEKQGLRTALDFVSCPESWASKLLGKVGRELWAELRGEYLHRVDPAADEKQLSISKTKTFSPPSSDRDVVWARALRNLESACIKARRHRLAARRLALFLRTQSFETSGLEAKLARPTAATNELTTPLQDLFDELFKPRTPYRATGVVLGGLIEPAPSQFTLFEDPRRALENERLFAAVDAAAERFGKHTVFIADGVRLKLEGRIIRQRPGVPLLRTLMRKGG